MKTRNIHLNTIIKTVILLCILIVSLSICYYFIVFLPEQERHKEYIMQEEIELSKQRLQQQELDRKLKEQKEINAQIESERRDYERKKEEYRKECIALEEQNIESFLDMVNSCKTEECVDNLHNSEIASGSYFGKEFVRICTENKLKGEF